MKNFAVSSLSLALLSGTAVAQSPFLRPAAQEVVPVAARTAAPTPYSHGGFVPVRVHFGGALTRDGVVPVPVFLHSNAQGPAPIVNMAPGVVPADRPLRQASVKAADENAQLPAPAADCAATGTCADEFYPLAPFQPPRMDDHHRPGVQPRGHILYTSLEYLHWWTKRHQSPPLLVVEGTPFRAEDFDGRTHDGGRFVLGYWLHAPMTLAVEGVFMFLGEENKERTFGSNGFPFIGRPFIADTGVPTILSVAALGQPGTSTLESHSRLYGFEVNLRREICRTTGGHFDMLVGYRQVHLDEGLRVSDSIELPGAVVRGVDEFGTHNQLFGGQFGLEAEANWGRLFVDVWGKFMLAGNAQTVNVNGATVIRTPGGVADQALPGNVLAQTTNIGKHRQDSFTVMPEAGFNIGMQITANWRLSAGYSVLFLNNVIRPGDQIDPVVNPTLIPQLFLPPAGTSRPGAPSFQESTYWAHGLNVQMEIRY
jgi:hypothetical protein